MTDNLRQLAETGHRRSWCFEQTSVTLTPTAGYPMSPETCDSPWLRGIPAAVRKTGQLSTSQLLLTSPPQCSLRPGPHSQSMQAVPLWQKCIMGNKEHLGLPFTVNNIPLYRQGRFYAFSQSTSRIPWFSMLQKGLLSYWWPGTISTAPWLMRAENNRFTMACAAAEAKNTPSPGVYPFRSFPCLIH